MAAGGVPGSAVLRVGVVAAVALALLLCPGASARKSRKIQLGDPDPKGRASKEHDHITFDPMVAEVERHRDDAAWEKEYEKAHPGEHHHLRAGHHHEHDADDEDGTEIEDFEEEDAEHEEFLHDAGVDDPESLDEDVLDHVNMERRIDRLFPLIDIAPADGKVDISELSAWELMQYEQMQQHRMARELEALDRNEDGKVSLREYMHEDGEGPLKHWKEYPEEDRDYYRQEQERFVLADDDGDGFLDQAQLYKVLHPEESRDPKILAHLRNEELRTYDVNHNSRIELDEWMEGFWHVVVEWEEEERKWVAKAQGKPHKVGMTAQEKRSMGHAKFRELDKDKDGALSADELEPIMFIMMPGEKHFSEQTARHLIEQADDDGDAKLTIQEMKKHKEVFYELERKEDDI